MLTKVQKWGNSLAIRLPKVLSDEIDIQFDSPVEITVRDHSIVVEPVRKKMIFDLDQLLSEVTVENCHKEAEFGKPTGKEFW